MSDTPTPAATDSNRLPAGQFYQYQVPQVGTVISYASPELLKKWGGLRSEAVVARAQPGTGVGKETKWGAYQASVPFRDLLHKVISTVGPTMTEYQNAAKGRDEGFVVVVDMRTPNPTKPPVPPTDIIGVFKVKDGAILPDGYMPNPQYRSMSANGPTLLPPPLYTKVMEALEALPPPAGKAA